MIDVRVFGSGERPRLLLIGSQHGNEPAGRELLKQFSYTPKPGTGTIIVVPNANPVGGIRGTREVPVLGDPYDLNRSYRGDRTLSKKIQGIVKDSDWIIDLHEGWGYAQVSKSVGSGIYSGNSEISKRVVENLKDRVNEYTAHNNLIPFVTGGRHDDPGTLEEFANRWNKNYILVETTGHNDIQPLQVRVDEMRIIIRTMIRYLRM
jgi:predicted deacylase